ncbi:hypothetical protein LEP1GSC170_2109 [Leptospira interrogans serovar Bataviae str. HAI135]|nr:hypothetical protein LEP1GSC170_2109 [Leptospira interrogans serovar Bataviae str. HAI135]
MKVWELLQSFYESAILNFKKVNLLQIDGTVVQKQKET